MMENLQGMAQGTGELKNWMEVGVELGLETNLITSESRTFNHVHIASTVLLFTEFRRLFRSALETNFGQSKGDSETLFSG